MSDEMEGWEKGDPLLVLRLGLWRQVYVSFEGSLAARLEGRQIGALAYCPLNGLAR